ncbi:MAG TPA: hypothetical protein VJT50_09445 [Pyrinomonadaceae bacterium]|nr:hypothetical protein [Pyrinomonadaceae bacterium]
MKQTSIVNALLALALLLACVLGCNKTGTRTANESNDTKPKEEAPLSDITGEYSVNGTNDNGTSYKGDLEVIKHGSVYEFRWNTDKQYGGVGVQNGNVVAVAFASGTTGKGCGVVSYRLQSDGVLDGKWGYWGVDESGTERAERTSGSGLSGDYNVTGTNPRGTNYKGTLTVGPEGGGYTFTWSNGSKGFGLKQGDSVSVGIGGARCGFVFYQVKAKGLEGIWGGYGSDKTGAEHATKK